MVWLQVRRTTCFKGHLIPWLVTPSLKPPTASHHQLPHKFLHVFSFNAPTHGVTLPVRMSPTISSSVYSSFQPLVNSLHINVFLVLHCCTSEKCIFCCPGLNWESPHQRRPKMPRKAGTLRHALLQQESDGGERTAVGLR